MSSGAFDMKRTSDFWIYWLKPLLSIMARKYWPRGANHIAFNPCHFCYDDSRQKTLKALLTKQSLAEQRFK